MDKLDGCTIYYVDWQTRKLEKKDFFPQAKQEPSAKEIFFTQLYDKGDTIYTIASTTASNVQLPDSCKNNAYTNLKWGKKFVINEFGFDRGGVFGYLTFRGVPHFVFLPWSSIIQISGETTGLQQTWAEKTI